MGSSHETSITFGGEMSKIHNMTDFWEFPEPFPPSSIWLFYSVNINWSDYATADIRTLSPPKSKNASCPNSVLSFYNIFLIYVSVLSFACYCIYWNVLHNGAAKKRRRRCPLLSSTSTCRHGPRRRSRSAWTTVTTRTPTRRKRSWCMRF